MANSQPNQRPPARQWTAEEIDWLREHYPRLGKLKCCEVLDRREAQVRHKAYELKLRQDRTSEFFKEWQTRAAKSKVGKKRPEQSAVIKRTHSEGKFIFTSERRAAISVRAREWIRNNGHPRGALGIKHSPETRKKLSEASLRGWSGMTPEKMAARAMKRALSGRLPRIIHGKWKAGWREVGGKRCFFRSRWEANYARVLQLHKEQGRILDWEYEAEHFVFPPTLLGVASFHPDFRITLADGSVEHHEVKGWMDDRSKANLRDMKIHYPSVVLRLIDTKVYRRIERKYASQIEGWESQKVIAANDEQPHVEVTITRLEGA